MIRTICTVVVVIQLKRSGFKNMLKDNNIYNTQMYQTIQIMHFEPNQFEAWSYQSGVKYPALVGTGILSIGW